MPDAFWSLTLREFWLKFAAFVRAEDRQRSLVFELALITGHYKDEDKDQLRRAVNGLRRYPIKKWLRPA